MSKEFIENLRTKKFESNMRTVRITQTNSQSGLNI